MDFSEAINSIVSFYGNNPIIAILIALVLIFLIWRKPKFFFSVLFIALLLLGIIHLIISTAGSGKAQKENLLQKEEKQIERTQ